MTHAGPPTGARISVLALCSMALPVFSVSPLLVHPRSAQSLPWRRARGRQKTPSEKSTDAVSSLLAAYPHGQRDGGGGHAADRRRPVRDGARAARRVLRGDLRDLRRPRLRPARQRERRLLQVQHRRGAAPPRGRRRRDGDSRRSGVDGAASNRATSRACSQRRVRRSSMTTSEVDWIFATAERWASPPLLSNNYFVVVSTQHAGALDRGGPCGAAMRDGGRRSQAARDAFHWTARRSAGRSPRSSPAPAPSTRRRRSLRSGSRAVADPRRRHFYTRGGDSAPPRRRSTVVATDKRARSASGGCSRNASPRRSTRGSRGLPPRAASGSSSWGARTSCASPSPNATRAAASVAWMAASGGAPASGARRRTDPGP